LVSSSAIHPLLPRQPQGEAALLGVGQNNTDSHLQKRQTYGTCGFGTLGDGICANGQCCSRAGWCGVTSDYCGGNSYSGKDVSPGGINAPMCGGGSLGTPSSAYYGFCSGGNCCSKYGWCGSTSDYCGGNSISGAQAFPVALPAVGSCGASSTLLNCHMTNIVNKFFTIRNGGSPPTATAISSFVTKFNAQTSGWNSFFKASLLAHITWESAGLISPEELACVISGATCSHYQTCDWNTGVQASNGQKFYGRGYLQLSWCANYKSYGTYLGQDLYNYPNKVLTNYALESAIWFYRVANYWAVQNCGTNFGCTTRVVNSIECTNSNGVVSANVQAAKNRYEIFKVAAAQLGLNSYAESGCY
jgi:chitinase